MVDECEKRVVGEWSGLQYHSKTPYLAELRGKTSPMLFIFLNAMRTLDIFFKAAIQNFSLFVEEGEKRRQMEGKMEREREKA